MNGQGNREWHRLRWSWLIGRVSLSVLLMIGGLLEVRAATSILPLGDSITEAERPYNSYRRKLWKLLEQAGAQVDFVGTQRGILDGTPPNPDFDLDHEGYWGWDTQEMLNYDGGLSTRLARYPVDIVLLLLGANDLSDCRGVSATLQGLSDMIDVLRGRNPRVTVLLGTLLPMNKIRCGVDANVLINQLNAQLPGFVSNKSTSRSRVLLVDLNSGFSMTSDLYDGVHPDGSGEEKIAWRWYRALVPLLGLSRIFSSSFE